MSVATDRELLTALYESAVAGALPAPATARCIESLAIPSGKRVWLISLGKAAPEMASGAVSVLTRARLTLPGGVVIGSANSAAPYGTVTSLAGDHPLPGPRSFKAAARIGEIAASRRSDDVVIVLLSGGATSLAAAPLRGLDEDDLTRLFELLLGSGLDIGAMNRVRKRFARWGAGRLAVALAPSRTHVLVVSDVIGNDLASIGSGPCTPDPTTVHDIVEMLKTSGLHDRIAAPYRDYLTSVARGLSPETPKVGHPAFAHVTHHIIADNRSAIAAAVAQARAESIEHIEVAAAPLSGEASRCGEAIARELIAARDAGAGANGAWCRLWGGETTVTLGSAMPPGRGGRCQELALAAARVLHEAGARANGITLLAAGTDGRDGPSDSAGACVDNGTWSAIAAAGHDASAALAGHRSNDALAAASALLPQRDTGTNVADVVVGLVRSG